MALGGNKWFGSSDTVPVVEIQQWYRCATSPDLLDVCEWRHAEAESEKGTYAVWSAPESELEVTDSKSKDGKRIGHTAAPAAAVSDLDDDLNLARTAKHHHKDDAGSVWRHTWKSNPQPQWRKGLPVSSGSFNGR